MRRTPLLALVALVFSGALSCRRGDSHPAQKGGEEPEVRRLELKADEALSRGRAHFAHLLLSKARGSGELSPLGDVTDVRARAVIDGPNVALSDAESALEEGAPVEALTAAPELAALMSDPAFLRAVERARRGNQDSPPAFEPAPPGAVDARALAELLKEAEAHRTSGLVVLRDGKLVGEWYFGQRKQRIEAMSATKSIVSLAVGLLIDDGKIESLDAPVSRFFPEWKGTLKEGITLRQLMSHTSGLEARRTTEDIYPQADFVRSALDAPLAAPPGTAFSYNNQAVNLLAGAVSAAAGEPIDEYLRHRLFAPLGIDDVTWSRDRAGNRHGMSGLQIHPMDFARIGQMLLDGGTWNGRRIVSAPWIEASALRPSQGFDPLCGLLWWRTQRANRYLIDEPLIAQLREARFGERSISKLQPLVGRAIEETRFRDELRQRLRNFEISRLERILAERHLGKPLPDEIFGYSARGSLGQVLLVVPKYRLVVVRMAVPRREVRPNALEFPELFALARGLVEPGWQPPELKLEHEEGLE